MNKTEWINGEMIPIPMSEAYLSTKVALKTLIANQVNISVAKCSPERNKYEKNNNLLAISEFKIHT